MRRQVLLSAAVLGLLAWLPTRSLAQYPQYSSSVPIRTLRVVPTPAGAYWAPALPLGSSNYNPQWWYPYEPTYSYAPTYYTPARYYQRTWQQPAQTWYYSSAPYYQGGTPSVNVYVQPY
jgi:hypothetical protein